MNRTDELNKIEEKIAENKVDSAENTDRVWFACRAGGACEGTWAVIQMKFPVDAKGGRSTRYICETCERPFHVRY